MANNNRHISFPFRPVLTVGVIFCLWQAAMGYAAEQAKVAVLPFRIYAPAATDQLKTSLQEMLNSRLGSRGLHTIPSEVVNRNPMASVPVTGVEELAVVGKDLGVRWVLGGSLTQIGKKLSLDLKLVDAEGKRSPFQIYQEADDMDGLPDAANRVAMSLDYQISGVPQIDSIKVRGNQRIETAAILALVRSKPGDRVDPEKLDQDLRGIYKMGFFVDIKVETEEGARGRVVVFEVTEKPSIGKIVFDGNKKLEEEDLRKEMGIKLYSILDRNQIRQSINRLKEFYRGKAYYNVEIEDKITPMPNNQVQLTYQITENEKVYVRKIEFVGNKHFKSGDLDDVMEISEKGWLSWLTDSGLLDQKKLEMDVQKLTSHYHNHGFIKAKVGEPKVTYEKDKGLTITIEIVEGPQYGVGRVSVEGELIRPAEVLEQGLKIRKQKVFSREVLRQDVMALRSIYSDEGYAYAEVIPGVKEDDEGHRVDIVLKVSKGDKVRFGRIAIAGNTKTRDKVIRRELWAVEGQYYSGKAMTRSSENLNRLGFFEEVEILPEKTQEKDRMDLGVRVKEKPTGSFSFGAGYSSQDKMIGMAKVDQNNFLGYGVRLSASVKIGGISNEFDVIVSDPWLFGRPISGEARGFKLEREYDEYNKDSFGGETTIGFPFRVIDTYTRGWLQYRYEDSDITEVDEDAALIIKDMEGRSVTSAATVGLIRNSTESAWNPRRGSINTVSMEYAGGFLGGDNYFNKYVARSAWFFPFPWETSVMLQGRIGYIDQREGGDLPVYEKFFLGGINTVRGFEYAEISPTDAATGDKIGGEKMMVYNVEYRFPLLKSQGILGVVFFDAGNVFTADESYTFKDIRMGAGGGIRWYSPMGPLRVEWGYNLDQREGEPSSQVDFTMGTTF